MKFNELDKIAKENGVGKSDWLRLEVGDNRIRIVSEMEFIGKHWGADRKSTVCVGKENGCIFCNGEDPKVAKPTIKFMFHCIDRKDGALRIGEVGYSIFKEIKDLSETEDYRFSDLPPYDMTIKKSVKGAGTSPSDTDYKVIAARQNSDLTEAEKAAIQNLQPIKGIVDSIKGKALETYRAMGMIPTAPMIPNPLPATAPEAPVLDAAPAFLAPEQVHE